MKSNVISIVNQKKLENVNFSADQAETIMEIVTETTKDKASHDQLQLVVTLAKYDLIKWIVGAVIANGIVATLLKFAA